MTNEELEKMAMEIVAANTHDIEIDHEDLGDRWPVVHMIEIKDAINEALRTVCDSVVTLPSKKEFEIFLKNTPHKKDQEAIDAIWDWLRSKLKPVQKGKFCPCGGIILADTEEFRTPLCCECYEEVLRSEPVQPISLEKLAKDNIPENMKKEWDGAFGFIGFQRLSEAKAMHQAGLDRVKMKPMPITQKFPPGTLVWIAKDLGSSMRHFQNNRPAMVQYTYAHAYPWGDSERDAKQYSLLVRYDDGKWSSVAWYYESQLTEITDQQAIIEIKKEIGKDSAQDDGGME